LIYNVSMRCEEVMFILEGLASHDPKDLAGMARFGINVDKAWVISIPKLRNLAKEIKRDVISTEMEKSSQGALERSLGSARDDKSAVYLHELALRLWDTGIHEAKILASMIDEPRLVTEVQMEKWVLNFDSWDVCDQVCSNLFDRTEFAVKKATEWSKRSEEFVKRAGFVLMAVLAVHEKTMPDKQFLEFLNIIKRESEDNRIMVRKAVNWALRSIGKSRNSVLYDKAMEMANKIVSSQISPTKGRTDSNAEGRRAARWIANDALRELKKDYIKQRFEIN
jgi:3-methyladenine DNA glycosylase AlkD